MDTLHVTDITKWNVYRLSHLATGLEISFDEERYSTGEGDIRGLSDISLSLGSIPAPFRVELIPVTVGVAKTQYNLTDFLTLDDITDDQEALSGDIFIVIMYIFYEAYSVLSF